MTIDDRIALWKSLPVPSVDETDGFVEMLVAEVTRLKAELREAEMDSMRFEKDRDRLAINGMEAVTEMKRWRDLAGKLAEGLNNFEQHDLTCILSQWSQGRPTENGGYETMYAGKWYQNRPVDETPKCQCGLDQALSLYSKEKP